MSVAEMSVAEMSVAKMSVAEMSEHRTFGRSCGTWPKSKVTLGDGSSGPKMAGQSQTRPVQSDGEGWVMSQLSAEYMYMR